MLVWAPISPASVPHKSDELPSMPPLSSINPPLLFLPSPLLFSPSWTSDQLRPCPALTACQHFLSSSYPLALSFFFSFWVSGQPLSTQRDREQSKGGRKKRESFIFRMRNALYRCECFSVSVCWKEKILLQTPWQEVYFLPARRLDFREEERSQKMKRSIEIVYNCHYTLYQFTWENTCVYPLETDSVGQGCSKHILSFWILV